jgi:uncharacterized protein (UPF0147 family)
MNQLNAKNFTIEQMLNMVKNDSTVNQTIRDAAEESPGQLWTLNEIQDNLYDALNLELNLDDSDACDALLAHYNK